MRLPEYDRLDATAMAALVARGEVHPAELLEAALERADVRDPVLNAIVVRHDEEARARARGPLQGPFAGVPFLLKDFLARKRGWPLTGSSRFLSRVVAADDGELVRRFEAAGLVAFGQTNTPELAIHAVTESRMRGACRNPWSLAHGPGGSSGGSAAAVAARIVPMAHGNDGGGSIRIPASACGLVGLKPTRARVPLAPLGEVFAGLVQDGVLCRSVRDAAAALDAIAGPAPGDPYVAPPPARPFVEEVGAPPGKLRIAFTGDSLFGRGMDPDCAAAVDDAALLLGSLGHEVVEARPTFDRERLVHAYLVLLAADVRASMERASRLLGTPLSRGGFEAQTWALATAGRVLRADDHATALADVREAGRAVAPFFASYDLLLTATASRPPVRVGELALRAWERVALEGLFRAPTRRGVELLLAQIAERSFVATGNTMLWNQTGQPAVSLPLSWSPAGLPIGIQLVARLGDEATLLRVAAQLEAARPWAGRLPPLLRSE